MEEGRARRIDLGFVNAWLLGSRGSFVLVDSGLPSHRQRLELALFEAGCEPGMLPLHILTHPDFDHAGNSAWIRERWGARIAIHGADAEALRSGALPRRKAIGRLRWLVALTQFGPRISTPCPVDLELEDGEDLGRWGLEAKVYHLPGHTAGSLGILTSAGEFLAGDLVSNWRRPGPGILASDLESYRRSLDRTRSLLPPGTSVLPGHGRPFPASELSSIRL